MSALGMEIAEQRDVLKDVFGIVEDGEKRLVDSYSSTEFEEKLSAMGRLESAILGLFCRPCC